MGLCYCAFYRWREADQPLPPCAQRWGSCTATGHQAVRSHQRRAVLTAAGATHGASAEGRGFASLRHNRATGGSRDTRACTCSGGSGGEHGRGGGDDRRGTVRQACIEPTDDHFIINSSMFKGEREQIDRIDTRMGGTGTLKERAICASAELLDVRLKRLYAFVRRRSGVLQPRTCASLHRCVCSARK